MILAFVIHKLSNGDVELQQRAPGFGVIADKHPINMPRNGPRLRR